MKINLVYKLTNNKHQLLSRWAKPQLIQALLLETSQIIKKNKTTKKGIEALIQIFNLSNSWSVSISPLI